MILLTIVFYLSWLLCLAVFVPLLWHRCLFFLREALLLSFYRGYLYPIVFVIPIPSIFFDPIASFPYVKLYAFVLSWLPSTYYHIPYHFDHTIIMDHMWLWWDENDKIIDNVRPKEVTKILKCKNWKLNAPSEKIPKTIFSRKSRI